MILRLYFIHFRLSQIFEHGIFEFGESAYIREISKNARKNLIQHQLTQNGRNISRQYILKMNFIKLLAKVLINSYLIWFLIYIFEILLFIFRDKLTL